jgi:hypothetical protein
MSVRVVAAPMIKGILLAGVILALAWIALPGAPPGAPPGGAPGPTVRTEGVITGVDEDGSAFTISGPQGTQEFSVTPDTAIGVGDQHIGFDALSRFVGVASVVLSVDTGTEQAARRVTLLVMPAQSVTPPIPSDEPRP